MPSSHTFLNIEFWKLISQKLLTGSALHFQTFINMSGSCLFHLSLKFDFKCKQIRHQSVAHIYSRGTSVEHAVRDPLVDHAVFLLIRGSVSVGGLHGSSTWYSCLPASVISVSGALNHEKMMRDYSLYRSFLRHGHYLINIIIMIMSQRNFGRKLLRRGSRTKKYDHYAFFFPFNDSMCEYSAPISLCAVSMRGK